MLPIIGVVALAGAGVYAHAQGKREVSVSARKYAYDVDGSGQSVLRVRKDQIVRVTFSAEDIPHSFTIDEYRISRRAEPGKPVTFEFDANRAGEFRIYCNLAIDERCRRDLHGTLIVQGVHPSPRARPRAR
ncbi:MAG TPA: cupredoxin domain-containing protein [Vicinamibacterales bacterium]|nr:cupredoxin domain-containing protein [Vicinamibacterales bacterium]